MNHKHGLCHTRLYKIWCKMKERCYNPKSKSFDNYGGRGIFICDEWCNDFAKFYDWSLSNGYKDDLTIDRINVKLGYFPENCRWATMEEQQNNRRDNVHIAVGDKIYTLSEYCKIKSIPPSTLGWRLRKKWSNADAINKPFEGVKERLLTFNGKTQNLNTWARETGISKITIRNRLNRYGWSIEEALTIKPIMGRKR